MDKRLIAAAAVVALVIAHLFRYDLQPTARADSDLIYKLDRWTGGVTLIHHEDQVRVKPPRDYDD